jgi:hypothetical protein
MLEEEYRAIINTGSSKVSPARRVTPPTMSQTGVGITGAGAQPAQCRASLSPRIC